jgi:LysM domain
MTIPSSFASSLRSSIIEFCIPRRRIISGALAVLVLVLPTMGLSQTNGGVDEATGGPSEPNENTPMPGSAPAMPPRSSEPADLNAYLPSGDRPIVGGQSQDGFDLNRGSSSGAVVLSGAGADAIYGLEAKEYEGSAPKKPVGPAPEFHLVKKGDTLWQISQGYYGDAHNWPRLWSMNPQIENPHWIYPGDQLRTNQRGAAQPTATSNRLGAIGLAASKDGRNGFIGGTRTLPAGTVFLRDQGYIGDPDKDDWGELVGAKEDRMILLEGDTVYLVMKKGVDVRVGQRLNLYRPIRSAPRVSGARRPPGALVKVFGTVRIDGWDKKERIAKGVLIESIDAVERGTRVGPVGRRFDVVPPKQAGAQVEARLLTGIHPHTYYGGQQVVFIDKGKSDGLVPGNRLRALIRGDQWRHDLKRGAKHQRTRVELDSDESAPGERIPLRGNDSKFPDEIVGELIVLRTEEYSSICLVSEANIELEPGDRVASTVGY